jgi:site-specific DNA-methyltransferase (adenine-specific)
MWVYGSGFPKSLNVGKAITAYEKTGSSQPKNLRQVRMGDNYKPTGQEDYRKGRMFSTDIENDNSGTELTESAQQWDGWGTALKQAHEPIVMARKPLDGTVANNVLKHGVGGINIDATRVPGEPVPINKLENWSGFGQDIRPDYKQEMNKDGRFPANFIHDGSDEVLALLPDSKGAFAPVKSGHSGKSKGIYNDYAQRGDDGATFYGDNGSAARFFYCAKASKAERNAGLQGLPEKQKVFNGTSATPASKADGSVEDKFSTAPSQNFHPTVKPLALMRYLVRLVTPPNGTVLDPFAGSGSTLVAATIEKFDCIGIEMTDEYLPIIEARVAHSKTDTLF